MHARTLREQEYRHPQFRLEATSLDQYSINVYAYGGPVFLSKHLMLPSSRITKEMHFVIMHYCTSYRQPPVSSLWIPSPVGSSRHWPVKLALPWQCRPTWNWFGRSSRRSPVPPFDRSGSKQPPMKKTPLNRVQSSLMRATFRL